MPLNGTITLSKRTFVTVWFITHLFFLPRCKREEKNKSIILYVLEDVPFHQIFSMNLEKWKTHEREGNVPLLLVLWCRGLGIPIGKSHYSEWAGMAWRLDCWVSPSTRQLVHVVLQRPTQISSALLLYCIYHYCIYRSISSTFLDAWSKNRNKL